MFATYSRIASQNLATAGRKQKYARLSVIMVNSLWPSYEIQCHRTSSTLVPVMACYLMKPCGISPEATPLKTYRPIAYGWLRHPSQR